MAILKYNAQEIQQRDKDGYVNATQMCQAGGKFFAHWKETEDYNRYVEALSLSIGIPIDRLTVSKPGRPSRGGGTWIHPKLAIKLARWISVEFELWCDEHIRTLIETGTTSLNRDTNWQLTRQSGKYNRNQFTDAIKFYLDNHPERSERYAKFVYSNATNQQYREVFGLPAKKLKELLGVPRTGLLRDYFPIEELGTIITLESVACTLVFDHGREPVTAIKEAIERTLCTEKHLEKYKDLKTLP